MKDTNFFEPYIETKKHGFKGKKGIFLVIVGVIIFMLLTFPLINKIRIYRMNREIVRIDNEVNSTQNKIKRTNIEQKRNDIAVLKEKDVLLETITTDFYKKDNVGDFLVYSITDSMTSGMFLKSLDITGDEAIVVGISQQKEGIARLERSLRRISYFKTVFIPNITLQEEFYEFTVNIKLNSEEVRLKKEEQAEYELDVDETKIDKTETPGGESKVEVETETE